jgi:hypothetical protein
MNDATTPIPAEIPQRRDAVDSVGVDHTGASKADLKDPRLVLSLLEADQVVAAKRETHFGRRKLSPGARVLLWGLRVYVLLMLVIVVISVLRAIHPAH